MAIKEKKEKQLPSFREIMSTEYRWETYLLGAVSAVALALALLMLTGVLTKIK